MHSQPAQNGRYMYKQSHNHLFAMQNLQCNLAQQATIGLGALHKILIQPKDDALHAGNFPLFFGRYRFVRKLGQGAFSQTVWFAIP